MNKRLFLKKKNLIFSIWNIRTILTMAAAMEISIETLERYVTQLSVFFVKLNAPPPPHPNFYSSPLSKILKKKKW